MKTRVAKKVPGRERATLGRIDRRMAQLADGVLVLHFLWVLGVLCPIPLIIVGGHRGWRWVRSPILRWSHFAMIGVVVAESLLGIVCPMTIWEAALRKAAGQAVSGQSFIEYWVGKLMFFNFPSWVFTVGYAAVGVTIAILLWAVPPRSSRRGHFQ